MSRAWVECPHVTWFWNHLWVHPRMRGFSCHPFCLKRFGLCTGLIESNVLGDLVVIDCAVSGCDQCGWWYLFVRLSLRNIGLWLKAMFGAPTTGDDPIRTNLNRGRSHCPVLPWKLVCLKFLISPSSTGVRASSMAFNFARSGGHKSLLVNRSGRNTANGHAWCQPNQADYTRFRNSKARQTRWSGAGKSSRLQRSPIATIWSVSKPSAMTARLMALIRALRQSGNITVRYADTTVMDAARAGTDWSGIILISSMPIASWSLKCHEVYLPKPKRHFSKGRMALGLLRLSGAKMPCWATWSQSPLSTMWRVINVKTQYSNEAYWLELGLGVKVKVRPCASRFLCACIFMNKPWRSWRRISQAQKIGASVDDLPDVENQKSVRRWPKISGTRSCPCGHYWLGRCFGIDRWRKSAVTPEIDELMTGFWSIAASFLNNIQACGSWSKLKKDLRVAPDGAGDGAGYCGNCPQNMWRLPVRSQTPESPRVFGMGYCRSHIPQIRNSFLYRSLKPRIRARLWHGRDGRAVANIINRYHKSLDGT